MKYVAYYRVSTRRQGRSGLGLDAQRAAVESFNGSVIAEYKEVESGRRNTRPELERALAHCRAAKATLLIAKLDRLSRNVAFLSALMDSGAEIVAADMPDANRLTLHIIDYIARPPIPSPLPIRYSADDRPDTPIRGWWNALLMLQSLKLAEPVRSSQAPKDAPDRTREAAERLSAALKGWQRPKRGHRRQPSRLDSL